MGIIKETNSVVDLCKHAPLRCDTHFKHNIKAANEFFLNPNIQWVSLGSILENVRNGMNVGTNQYSMDETDILYISVSQIKEHGLITKNQNYLAETVSDEKGYFEILPNSILVTRSGTIGVAISSDHPSFNLEEKIYIASGFVITAEVKEGVSSKTIANYINLFSVQKYLTAMSAGACQKNISQPTICNLPIPEVLLQNNSDIDIFFQEYEKESMSIVCNIAKQEIKLAELKTNISHSISTAINNHYASVNNK